MKRIFFIFLILFSLCGQAQVGTNPNYLQSKSVLALAAGYEFFKYHGLELGLAYANYSHQGKMKYGKGAGLSGTMIIDTVPSYGPKVSCWMNGGYYHLSLGAWAGYFFNRNGSSIRICPQLGFGGKRWRINYGYSFGFTGQDFSPANTHLISFNILVDLLSLGNKELGADKTLQKTKKNPNIVPR